MLKRNDLEVNKGMNIVIDDFYNSINRTINRNVMFKRYLKRLVCLIIIMTLVLTTGCTNVDNNDGNNSNGSGITSNKSNNSNKNNKNGKGSNEELNFTYNFNTSADGFTVNKTDVETGYKDSDYDFSYRLEEVPIAGNGTKGLAIEANNKNADMFVYVFKEINENDEIEANTTYNAKLNFDIATNIKDEAIGKKTFVKAGVSGKLPLPEEKSNRIEFNLDKGNNEVEGKDLKTLEGITKPNKDTEDYEYKNYQAEMTVTSNKDAMIYAIVGLDSSYDGKIKFYIDNVKLKLEKVKDNDVAANGSVEND